MRGLTSSIDRGTTIMKKTIQITSLLAAVATASISTGAFAETDNCNSFWPKLPYNCVLHRGKALPAERADFSAFETGTTKTSSIDKAHYTHRSISRYAAKQLRQQSTEAENR